MKRLFASTMSGLWAQCFKGREEKMKKENKATGIKTWPEEDRPRV